MASVQPRSRTSNISVGRTENAGSLPPSIPNLKPFENYTTCVTAKLQLDPSFLNREKGIFEYLIFLSLSWLLFLNFVPPKPTYSETSSPVLTNFISNFLSYMRIRDTRLYVLGKIRAGIAISCKFSRLKTRFDLLTLDPIGLSPLITSDSLLNHLFESKILNIRLKIMRIFFLNSFD